MQRQRRGDKATHQHRIGIKANDSHEVTSAIDFTVPIQRD
jgi:hypothetical protein